MKKKKESFDTLDNVLEAIWMMPQRGVSRFRDPFHWPVLGTMGKTGCSQRTVILRQLVLSERVLVCHTDSRAAKAREINDSNGVTWLFYHPKKNIQLRISGPATLHTNDSFADAQWAATRITSRINYCAVDPPGTPVTAPSSGLPDFMRNSVPTLLNTERGRKNFMAISCRIDAIDWVLLSVMGNRRARFIWDDSGMDAIWLVP